MSAGAEFAATKQISLTTYRKDGTPVATPIWQVMDGGEMFMVSEAGAWKVKRIRNNGRVSVAACDLRGNLTAGVPAVEGTARLLDEQGTAHARSLLARRYVMSRVGNGFARLLRLKRPPMIGIAIRF